MLAASLDRRRAGDVHMGAGVLSDATGAYRKPGGRAGLRPQHLADSCQRVDRAGAGRSANRKVASRSIGWRFFSGLVPGSTVEPIFEILSSEPPRHHIAVPPLKAVRKFTAL